MKAAPLNEAGLSARNRRSAARLLAAVLLFHGLALGAGAWVLRQATHADTVPVHATVPLRLPAPGGVQKAPPRADVSPPDLPRWVLQARHHDTAAPWAVDAQGHVLLPADRR